MLSFFPLDVLDKIFDLNESVSEGFMYLLLKTLLLQGLSEPEFDGDLVYNFRKIIGKMIYLIISKR